MDIRSMVASRRNELGEAIGDKEASKQKDASPTGEELFEAEFGGVEKKSAAKRETQEKTRGKRPERANETPKEARRRRGKKIRSILATIAEHFPYRIVWFVAAYSLIIVTSGIDLLQGWANPFSDWSNPVARAFQSDHPVLSTLVFINVLLALFNLIPLGIDGGGFITDWFKEWLVDKLLYGFDFLKPEMPEWVESDFEDVSFDWNEAGGGGSDVRKDIRRPR